MLKIPEKVLDTINTFCKVAGYKIYFKKSAVFLYTNNEQTEKEGKKIIPFTIPSKKKYNRGLDLAKHVNDLYKENYKPLKKENERRLTEDGKVSHDLG
jgi:hypothetical protein